MRAENLYDTCMSVMGLHLALAFALMNVFCDTS